MQNVSEMFALDVSLLKLGKAEADNLLKSYATGLVFDNQAYRDYIQNHHGALNIKEYDDYVEKVCNVYNILLYPNIKDVLMEMANQLVENKKAKAQYKRECQKEKPRKDWCNPEPKRLRLRNTP